MDGLGGGLTQYQNGLQQPSGATPGLPNLPGMGGEFGGQKPSYFPSPGAAAVGYAQQRHVGEIPMDINSSNDVSNPQYSVSAGQEQGDSPAPNIKQPGFLDVIKQGGLSAGNSGLSKGGKLIAALLTAAKGAAAGSAGGGFGQGFALAGQQSRQEKQDQEHSLMQRIELARQQQQDARQAAEDKSQAELRRAQVDNYKTQAGKRELTPQEILQQKHDAAISLGYQKGTPEYNKYVLDMNPDHSSQTEWSAYLQANGNDPAKALAAKQRDEINKSATVGSMVDQRRASRDEAAGDAEGKAASIVNRAGGDPDKALAMFDKAAPLVTDPKEKRQLKAIREAIRGRKRVNSGLDAILNQ